MSLDELKRKFILDDDALKARLEIVIEKALKYCQLDKKGQVSIGNSRLGGKDRVKLVLAARSLASQLDDSIDPRVSVAEIGKYAGLPQDQVRARMRDAITERFAESPSAGTYQAAPHKIEAFLDDLAATGTGKGGAELIRGSK